MPLLRAKFLPQRYIHKSVSLMLVFGYLKRRTFKTRIKNNAKDDATGVVYIPWVCFGAFLSQHAFRAIYTQRGYLFIHLFSMAILRPQIANG